MATIKKLGNFKGNDVELCRTTNSRVGNQAVKALLDASIPFTKNSSRVPFFLREKYNGAEEVTVIKINPHRYSQARRTIDRLDRMYKERLVVSNY